MLPFWEVQLLAIAPPHRFLAVASSKAHKLAGASSPVTEHN